MVPRNHWRVKGELTTLLPGNADQINQRKLLFGVFSKRRVAWLANLTLSPPNYEQGFHASCLPLVGRDYNCYYTVITTLLTRTRVRMHVCLQWSQQTSYFILVKENVFSPTVSV